MKTGGPAFPGGCFLEGPEAAKGYPTQCGMSLRDWFAGQAQSHLEVKFIVKVYQKGKKQPDEVQWPPMEWSPDKVDAVAKWEAAYAYAVADAMLIEREKVSE